MGHRDSKFVGRNGNGGSLTRRQAMTRSLLALATDHQLWPLKFKSRSGFDDSSVTAAEGQHVSTTQ
jgi:hypothetical protein